jgi:hypothetical protein
MKKELKHTDLVELKTLADSLVKTLGSMDSRTADKIVADVANTIYRNILGLNGRIVKTGEVFVDYEDGKGEHGWEYKFIEEK